MEADASQCRQWTVSQTQCRTGSDGNLKCENLRRQFRKCPGMVKEELGHDGQWRPVSEAAQRRSDELFDAHGSFPRELDPRSDMEDMFRAFQEGLRSFGFGFGGRDGEDGVGGFFDGDDDFFGGFHRRRRGQGDDFNGTGEEYSRRDGGRRSEEGRQGVSSSRDSESLMKPRPGNIFRNGFEKLNTGNRPAQTKEEAARNKRMYEELNRSDGNIDL